MGKHIDFYNKCMVDGRMPAYYDTPSQGGLCSMSEKGIIDKRLLNLFDDNFSPFQYWGDGREDTLLADGAYLFTSLRQTIVLFMAAMNNEL
jgi:hypothetical protein